jgi:hypothetical protein
VPARLAALRHDDLSADFYGSARLLKGLHLAGERHAGPVDALGEFPWVTERQHDRRGTPVQGDVQQLRITGEAPGDESDADSGALRLVELALQPIGITVTAADQAQAAGRRHDRGQPAAGYVGHRGEQDWVVDAEEFGEAGTQCHFNSPVRNCARPWPKDQSS